MSSFSLQEIALSMLGYAVRTHLEPRMRNLPLWDNGLGALAHGIVQNTIPNLTGDQIAQNLLMAMGMKPPSGRSPIRYSAGGRLVNDQGQHVDYRGRVIDVTGGPA